MCIGNDTTETIDLIPAQVIVRRDQGEKLACDDCEAEVVRAPIGDKSVEGGKYGDALVIDILVGKYGDGLPLHRQRERYQRLGLDLAVATLVDQVRWSTDLLRPLWRAAVAECIASAVMHLDATGLPVLDRAAPSGKRIGARRREQGIRTHELDTSTIPESLRLIQRGAMKSCPNQEPT